VEANALRAGIVARAEDWQWSGLWRRKYGGRKEEDQDPALKLSDWPVERPRNWLARVNASLPSGKLEALRECVDRGRPYGSQKRVSQNPSDDRRCRE
jgi:putative transposase